MPVARTIHVLGVIEKTPAACQNGITILGKQKEQEPPEEKGRVEYMYNAALRKLNLETAT